MFARNLQKNKEKQSRTLVNTRDKPKDKTTKEALKSRIFSQENEDPEYERFSKLQLSSRIASIKKAEEFLNDTEIRQIKSLCNKNTEIEFCSSNYSVVGALKNVPEIIEKAAGKKSIKFILSDLRGCDTVVICCTDTLTDIERYRFGYIVAVKTPSCTNQPLAFLTVKSQDQLLLIGKSKFAESNSLCDYHLANAYQVSRRKRSLFYESTTPTILLPQKIKKIKAESVEIPYSLLDYEKEVPFKRPRLDNDATLIHMNNGQDQHNNFKEIEQNTAETEASLVLLQSPSCELTLREVFNNMYLRRIVKENHGVEINRLCLNFVRAENVRFVEISDSAEDYNDSQDKNYNPSMQQVSNSESEKPSNHSIEVEDTDLFVEQNVIKNKRDPEDYSNVLLTVSTSQANIYDNEHCGDHLDIMSNYRSDKENSIVTGCWVSASLDSVFCLGDCNGSIKVISVANSKEIAIIEAHNDKIVDLQPFPTMKLTVLSVSQDKIIKLWDITSKTPLLEIEYSATVASFSLDGKWLVTGSSTGEIRLWDLSTFNLKTCQKDVESAKPLSLSVESSIMICPAKKTPFAKTDCIKLLKGKILSKNILGRFELYDIENKKILNTFTIPNNENNSCTFDVRVLSKKQLYSTIKSVTYAEQKSRPIWMHQKSILANCTYYNIIAKGLSTKADPQELVNENIHSKTIFLILADGTQQGVTETQVALKNIDKTKFYIRVVDSSQVPPIAKVFSLADLNKRVKKAQDSTKQSKPLKIKTKTMEIKSGIQPKDLIYKNKQVKSFLESRYRVLIKIVPKDRKSEFQESAKTVMNSILEDNKGLYSIIREPVFENRTYLAFIEGKVKVEK
ncbi:hypothetical protein BB561_002369 [Smittium simulii]|uniref:Translation initiation factor 3 N-terminal domain-containing protein n=1 Tax=Smittium simulii TaxID=133385 RepID=A0A2T9YQQ5_9FUNG|nr:hypothetical protein BB561_002369 [Smittium simulii]